MCKTPQPAQTDEKELSLESQPERGCAAGACSRFLLAELRLGTLLQRTAHFLRPPPGGPGCQAERGEWGFMAGQGPPLSPSRPGARGGAHLSPGCAALKGSRQRGHAAKPRRSSGKADLGQEEPGRGTNDSLSHILQGGDPAACVAFGAGRSRGLGSFLSQNKSAGPVTRAQPRNAPSGLPLSRPAHVRTRAALKRRSPARRAPGSARFL